jgi:hypothetical protein
MMRGIENINNICLNMLAGTTPEWLKTALPEESLGGGFMSRLVMVNRYELTKEPNAFPEDMLTSLESKEARERCKNDLQLISGMSGPFEWTPQSKNLYQDWFHDENIPDLQTCESFLRGYFGRKGDLIIKLAMIFSAATSPSKVLDQKDIWNAISLLKENEKYLSKVTDYMGRTEVGKNVEKVLGIIKKYQPCPHSRVMQSVSHQMDKNQLRDVIETLLEAGHILRTRTEKGGNLYTIKT